MLERSVTPEGGDSIRESRRWQARPIEKMKVVIIKDSESLGGSQPNQYNRPRANFRVLLSCRRVDDPYPDDPYPDE